MATVKMSERQACEVLELRPPFTAEDAKSAYRALALKHHPDRGGNDDDMKLVNAAYDLVGEGIDYAVGGGREGGHGHGHTAPQWFRNEASPTKSGKGMRVVRGRTGGVAWGGEAGSGWWSGWGRWDTGGFRNASSFTDATAQAHRWFVDLGGSQYNPYRNTGWDRCWCGNSKRVEYDQCYTCAFG